MNFIKYFFCFISFYSFAIDPAHKRNMIILLNQEDNCENIGKPHWHYLSCKFQSALQEKCSPILINASLVNAFIEKRKSIQQMSSIKGTEEENARNSFNAINKQLNAHYAQLRAKGFNPMQSKQFMIDAVNKEFYTPEAVIESQKKSIRPISENLAQALRSYETKFETAEWSIYTNNKSLYLFVPKCLAKSAQENKLLENDSDMSWEQKNQSHFGLKLTSLTKVTNIEDAVKLYFDSKRVKQYPISEQLHDFFIPSSTEISKPSLPWNIVFSGHGGTWYESETDSFSQIRLADVTIPDFRNILDFFNTQISTQSFHYATCFGAGKRIELVFNQNQTYKFPIICDCTSDGEAYCMVRSYKLPTAEGKLLQENDIALDEKGNWKLHLDYGYKWADYFDKIADYNFSDPAGTSLCSLYDTLSTITENMISNIPQVRFPNTTSFTPLLSNNTTLLNDSFVNYHLEQGDSCYTLADRFAILVSSQSIPFPLVFDNEYNSPHIISLIPGPSQHYFKELIFKTVDHTINAFWPVQGDRFNRYFIAETVKFSYEENSELLKLLQVSGPTVELQNVMVHSQTEDILRIFAQTKSGDSYMIVANKTDRFAQKVSVKGVHQLTPKVAQTYLSRYNQIKHELFGSKG